MIEIIPAIDIIDGRCVRLTKGDYAQKKVYDSSPVDMAVRYADCGVKRIHLVDLDGAKASCPMNLKTLEQIASKVSMEIEWGGGLSGDSAVKDMFNAGATCGIIGSVAVRKPELMHRWLEEFGAGKMILGADIRDRMVAVKGWLEDSSVSIDDLIKDFLPDGLSQVICTDISRDGMLQGPSFGLYSELQDTFPDIIFTVSGGISSFDDIEKLDAMGQKRVIVGKAIYEGRISLKQIEQWSQNA
ncbi:MAG: 1-(5-phosphoribosyl)-5-[(5-phosphoribosylamino)methylideneamino]imidazole-4-carboxamide isomerase [Bacteroidia bacterium]|nr:1-(5-phosphoribosyl)-5-[(5-phosphoribosylamino)methylideneamino]imidazole-4-carboxamide isomerase [Bacteroidia bacterium]